MQRFRFPIAVALTSLSLVAVLVLAGGLVVSNALASSPIGVMAMGAWQGGPPWAAKGDHTAWQATNLPPELAGLRDIPADERFSHFRGVQVSLTDQNNQPLTIGVTPGTVSAASDTSLTVAGNDGTSRTYALDSKTIRRGKNTAGALSSGDQVVVVSINNSPTALAVVAVDPNGMGHRGPFNR